MTVATGSLTPDALAAQLQQLQGIPPLTVSGDAFTGSYLITYSRAGAFPPLQIGGSTGGLAPTLALVSPGASARGGSAVLSAPLPGGGAGTAQCTLAAAVPLPEQVAAALACLGLPPPSSLVHTASQAAINWTATFAALDALPAVTVAAGQLTGTAAALAVVAAPGVPRVASASTFRLALGAALSPPLSANATAAAVQAAVAGLLGSAVAQEAVVLKSSPGGGSWGGLGDTGAAAWDVVLPLSPLSPPTTQAFSVVFSAWPAGQSVNLTPTAAPLYPAYQPGTGTVTLAFKGSATPPLPLEAPPSAVQAALNALPTVGGSARVSAAACPDLPSLYDAATATVCLGWTVAFRPDSASASASSGRLLAEQPPTELTIAALTSPLSTGLTAATRTLQRGQGLSSAVSVSMDGGQTFTAAAGAAGAPRFTHYHPGALLRVVPVQASAAGGAVVNISLAFAANGTSSFAAPALAAAAAYAPAPRDFLCAFELPGLPAAQQQQQRTPLLPLLPTALTATPGALLLQCLTPSLPPGVAVQGGAPRTAALRLSFNGGTDWSASSLPFTFTPPADLRAVVPSSGPVQGGTLVEVRGVGLPTAEVPLAHVLCRFGAAPPSPALAASPTSISCLSPPVPGGAFGRVTAVALEVSTSQGADWSALFSQFTYTPPAAIAALHPAAGTVAGGERVLLTGSGFSNASSSSLAGGEGEGAPGNNRTTQGAPLRLGDLQCSFGGRRVPGVYEPGGAVACTAPPLGGASATQTLTFVLPFNAAAAHGCIPSSAAAASAATPLAALALATVPPDVAIQLTATRQCSSEDPGLPGEDCSPAGAARLAPFTLPADAPPALILARLASWPGAFAAPPVAVAVGYAFGAAPGTVAVSWNITLSPEDGAFPPLAATATLGSTEVLVRPVSRAALLGANLSHYNLGNLSSLPQGRCYTDSSPLTRSQPHADATTTLYPLSGSIPATVTTARPGLSAAALAASLTGPLPVPLELSFNGGRDWSSSGLPYTYLRSPTVTALQPSHGPLTGGTRVLLQGLHLPATAGSLFCAFAGEGAGAEGGGAPAAAVVPAVELSPNGTWVVCLAPPALRPGPVHVRVSLSGGGPSARFSSGGGVAVSGGVAFTYDPPLTIASLEPVRGGVAGGTTVVLTGTGFLPTAQAACRFGAGSAAVPALWLSPHQLSCTSPPSPSGAPGVVALAVTANGQDWSAGGGVHAFHYHPQPAVFWVGPILGAAGTEVAVHGENFPNVTTLTCRFGAAAVPAHWLSSSLLTCLAPALPPGALAYTPLTSHLYDSPHPLTAYQRLFPFAPPFPAPYSHLVRVDVSFNRQQYTRSPTARFLYAEPPSISSVFPPSARDTAALPLWVTGANFVNTTGLACRVGASASRAVFLSPTLLLCFPAPASPSRPNHATLRHGGLGIGALGTGEGGSSTSTPLSAALAAADGLRSHSPEGLLFVEVSLNDGADWSRSRAVFERLPACPGGHWCPPGAASATYPCPRGTFCPGTGNANFTLCPSGTYQPLLAAAACLRCPIGYACPLPGMHAPRLCPAGYVCDVTGTELPLQPCPAGHYCLEGTGTTATSCGSPGLPPSSRLTPTQGQAELVATVRAGRRGPPPPLTLGSRATACWDNATADFGLQVSRYPARFWSEAHLLPLDAASAFAPRRGRYCLDDACLRLGDEGALSVSDASFDYTAFGFPIRRPLPCPPGVYCAPGTATPAPGPGSTGNLTQPQPCSEALFCPEGSASPAGAGETPAGSYSPYGTRLPCPAGMHCPVPGLADPLPCPPGTFNAQLGQTLCTPCPPGYLCPGFGRLDPAICPPGYVCSREGLASPATLCPAGFFCPNGTATSDPWRNDTSLRPYPCRPGVYCLAGTGYDRAMEPYTPGYARNCTAGFFCELGSVSPTGTGPCPLGFVCPEGTAVPVPAPRGTYAGMVATVASANCLPGYYAPTIQTIKCYPCPPGSSCENDGSASASVCRPGTYHSISESDGTACAGCPQGTWSKQWEVRDQAQCLICPPGVVCPLNGLVDPCTFADLPQPWVAAPAYGDPRACCQGTWYLVNGTGTCCNGLYSGGVCLLDSTYALQGSYRRRWGAMKSFRGADGWPAPGLRNYPVKEADANWPEGIATHYRGYDLDPDPTGLLFPKDPAAPRLDNELLSQCYESAAPNGSVVYSRYSEFYGPLFETVVGQPHQGYGWNSDAFPGLPQPTYYGAGSRHIPLIGSPTYDPNHYCHKGHYETVYNSSAGGYVRHWLPGDCEGDLICAAACPSGREEDCPKAQAYACPEGYVCPAGTTALTQTDIPCPGGYVCDVGTTPDTSLSSPQGQYKLVCLQGYYCATATGPTTAKEQPCPTNYFCPTGTWDPLAGMFANDAMNRAIAPGDADPFANIVAVDKRYDGVRLLMNESLHNQRCFLAVQASSLSTLTTQIDTLHTSTALAGRTVVNGTVAEVYASLCARDHQWAWVARAQQRGECFCNAQTALVQEVWRLYKCTEVNPLLYAQGLQEARPVCEYWGYPQLGVEVGSATAVPANWTSGLYGNETRTATLLPVLGAYTTLPDITVQGRLMPGFVLNYGLQLPPPATYLGASAGPYGRACESLWFPSPAEPYPGYGANRTWVGAGGEQPGTAAFWDQLTDSWVLNGHCASRGDLFVASYLSVPAFRVAPYSVACPVFCAFSELKVWVDAVYAANASATVAGKVRGDATARIPRLVYDLKYAVDLLDTFASYSAPTGPDDDPWLAYGPGSTLPDSVVGWDAGLLASAGQLAPLRLDTCHCESTLRCPNGTTSIAGSTSIYDCTVTSQEVLARFVPIPPGLYNPLYGTDQMTNLTSPLLADLYTSNPGLPLVFLRGGQKLSLTLDLGGLPPNMTYALDYALAVYPDAHSTPPCPARYKCMKDRVDCEWPGAALQAAYGVYCADQRDAGGELTAKGCCGASTIGTPDSLGPKTAPMAMPYWLSPESLVRPDEPPTQGSANNAYRIYPALDNKHGLLTFTLSAIRDTYLLIAVELYNGLYVSDFGALAAAPGLCEAQIYEPYRASYSLAGPGSTGDPGRAIKSFMAMVIAKDFSSQGLQLPYNLPLSPYTLPQAVLAQGYQFENRAFIDRPADTRVAQYNYWSQRSLRASGALYIPSASASVTPTASPSPSGSPEPTTGRRARAVGAVQAAAAPAPWWRYSSRESQWRAGVLSPLTSADTATEGSGRAAAAAAAASQSRGLRTGLFGRQRLNHTASLERALALGEDLAVHGPVHRRMSVGEGLGRAVAAVGRQVGLALQPLAALLLPLPPLPARAANATAPNASSPARSSRSLGGTQPFNLHETAVAVSSQLLAPHVYLNASRAGPQSPYQFGYWEPGLDYPAGGFHYGLWGAPLSLGDYTASISRSEAARAMSATYGCPLTPPLNASALPRAARCRRVVDWYTGGAVFFSRSGQALPPNPHLIPLTGIPSLPAINYALYLTEQDSAVDNSTGIMCQPTAACWKSTAVGPMQAYQLIGESGEDYQWRMDVGLFCLAVESDLACAQRLQRIYSWWARHANYRARPPADIARDPLAWTSRDVTFWATSDPSGANAGDAAVSSLMLPYLPYFSNCDGYDSHVDIAKLTETHPDCTYVPAAQTVPVAGLFFLGQFYPKGDQCTDPAWRPDSAGAINPGLPLYCTYEENIFVSDPSARWYEAPPGTTLFYLTGSAIDNKDFVGGEGEFWGRNAFTLGVETSLAAKVPVIVEASSPPWQISMVPRSVNFTVSYYQKAPTERLIIRASVTFGNYCTTMADLAGIAAMAALGVGQCASLDFSYTLLFSYLPMWWLDLLNYFAFDFTAYLVLYIAIGLAIMVVGLAFYVLHRFLSPLRIKPKFRILTLMEVITPAPVVGVLLATACVFSVLLIYIALWLLSASPSPTTAPSLFEGISGDWGTPIASASAEDINHWRLGRLGVSFLVLGVYTINLATCLLTPEHSIARLAHEDNAMLEVEVEEEVDEEGEGEEADAEKARAAALQGVATGGRLGVQGPAALYGKSEAELGAGYTDDGTYTPLRWKRGAVYTAIFLSCLAFLAYLHFSYSLAYFTAYAPYALPVLKAGMVLYDGLVRSTVREALLGVPFTVVFLVWHTLSIYGSQLFFGFITNTVIVLATTSVLRLYVIPWYNNAVITLPLRRLQLKLWWERGLAKTRDQRLSDAQALKALRAACATETDSMEPILESYMLYSAEATALVMAPFFQFLIYCLDASPALQGAQGPFQVTGIPGGYRIASNHLIYYAIFSCVLIPCQLIMDIFLANALEVFHGWNFFEYVSFQRYRFSTRDTRWHMDSFVRDTSISEHLQSADRMCFSSQYYFLVSGFAWGAIVFMLGLLTLLNNGVNMWLDWLNVVNVGLSLLLAMGVKRALHAAGRYGGLWTRLTLEGTLDDEIGTSLAMVEGDAAALAVERIELAAMNSERFRKLFIDRAKPWLLTQLHLLLTPRMLARSGTDGRPFKEGVRDAYEALIKMSEHAKMESDERAKTELSGEEAEEARAAEAQAKAFSAMPSPGFMSRQVLLWWLGGARRSLRMGKLVRGTMEAARRPKCDLCGRHEGEVGTLRIDVALGGRYEPGALGGLMRAFDEAQKRLGIPASAPLDVPAWKSFFRTSAEYIMRCEPCVANRADTARMMGQRKEFGVLARLAREEEKAVELAALGLDAEDDAVFDPVAIPRVSPAGRALGKWLSGARLRIGGLFPKSDAVGEMAEYAEQAEAARARRRAKLEGAKGKVLLRAAQDGGVVFEGTVALRDSATALMLKLLFAARASLPLRAAARVSDLQRALEAMCRTLTPATDWHYSTELRLKGIILIGDGRAALGAVERAKAEQARGEAAAVREQLRQRRRGESGIVLARAKLREKLEAQEVIFTERELREMAAARRSIGTLETSLAEVPDTSSLAADLRFRIKTQLNLIAAIRAAAALLITDRQAKLKVGVEGQIRGVQVALSEQVVKLARTRAELWSAALLSIREGSRDFVAKAEAWLAEARDKQSSLAEATKSRGRLGLAGMLGSIGSMFGMGGGGSSSSSASSSTGASAGTTASRTPSRAADSSSASPRPGTPGTPGTPGRATGRSSPTSTGSREDNTLSATGGGLTTTQP